MKSKLEEIAAKIHALEKSIADDQEVLKQLRYEARIQLASSNLQLSERQRQVLILCKTKCNKDIARELNIGVRTVKWHISILLKKFGVNARYELP